MGRKLQKKTTNNDPNNNKLNFNLLPIQPLTENQKLVFRTYQQGKHLMLHGLAGTGKSFLAIYLTLNEILNTHDCKYKKLIILRSAVATRDIGYMPGKAKDKAGVYEAPYYMICNKLYNRGDAYDYLKQKGLVEFTTTSFVRGMTWENCIVLVDEMENLNLHELDSVITRVGNNCKIIFCGDFSQSDFTKESDRRGLPAFMKIIERISSFGIVEFDSENDIVRSGLAKEYIIQKRKLGIET